MANTQAMCNSFKKELLNGSHALGTQAANGVRTVTTKDVFKGALYVTTATMDSTTTAYSTTNEVTNGAGAGYTAGGATITNATVPSNTTTTAFWTPSASITWTSFTSAAAFDALLIYNSSSTGVLSVSVHTFGSQSITAGTFTLSMPTNDATTGLIRITA